MRAFERPPRGQLAIGAKPLLSSAHCDWSHDLRVFLGVILLVIKYTIGLRVSEEVEVEGLDINLHGEIVHG